jgi:CRISPR-associated endonuclease Cas2
MWIAVAFDISVMTAQSQRNYRAIRKKLLATGFMPIQKSFLWRWVENNEKANLLINKIQKFIPSEGNFIILRIPDISFKNGLQLIDGERIALPDPPVPWMIFC